MRVKVGETGSAVVTPMMFCALSRPRPRDGVGGGGRRSIDSVGKRSCLDAIHPATTLSLEPDVDGLVVYDKHLAAAARSAGLRVWAPS